MKTKCIRAPERNKLPLKPALYISPLTPFNRGVCVKLNNAWRELVKNVCLCPAWVMIGTPVDHTALSLSGSSDCSFNCAALQRELHWGGKEKEWGGVLYFCIFLFVAGEQWRGRICQGEGSLIFKIQKCGFKETKIKISLAGLLKLI